ncbi:MAG TPA: cytochrome c oxidase subunit II [Gemmatimonadota bacterium]|nr:cytochrome c oxidase subunit II [Gemmatimonadota bacterium]
MNWSWFLSEPVSTFGARIDSIYYVILWITGAVFVLTEGLLVYFVIKYRHREGRRAHYSHGNAKLEVAWTVIPFVIVLAIAWVSAEAWLEAKVPDRTAVAEGDVTMRVMAKQFEWNVTYAGPDGQLDTDDDFVKRNQLHVPVGAAVRIELMAEDVIHSFFLPDLRVKQDAVPGMMIPVWFQATRAGEYPLACAELCGLGHYRMRATLTVHEPDAYQEWLAAETEVAPPAPETVPAPADTAEVELGGEPADPGEERA